MVEIDNILSQVNVLVNSSSVKENTENNKDFCTKEQRDTFNEIMSKFTGTKKTKYQENSEFYVVGDSIYIEHNLKTHNFYIRYEGFWSVFESKFNLNYIETSELLRGLLKEYLKCEVNTTD